MYESTSECLTFFCISLKYTKQQVRECGAFLSDTLTYFFGTNGRCTSCSRCCSRVDLNHILFDNPGNEVLRAFGLLTQKEMELDPSFCPLVGG